MAKAMLNFNLKAAFSEYRHIFNNNMTRFNAFQNRLTVKSDTEQNIFIDFANVRKTCLLLRAINHKLRQQILYLLEKESRLTVTDIHIHLGIEQSDIQFHKE